MGTRNRHDRREAGGSGRPASVRALRVTSSPTRALFTRRLVHAQAGEERELDEINPQIDDFQKWSYRVAGENPLAWHSSAKDLLDGAMAVKAKVQPFSNAMHTLARVEAMLLGMALECLLKGIYIKRHRVWADPTKEHALVKDGKYVGVKDAGDHELLQLADAAGVTVSESERSILSCLTDFIRYAGRYPVPLNVEGMKPVRKPDGHTVARGYLSGVELERAETLTKRLMQEITS